MTNFDYDEKTFREIIAQNCVLNEENSELQKQVDELKKRLHWIWAIGVDYDGCDGVESLKGLIDEMVELTQIESKDLDEYFTYNTTQGGKMNILSIVRKVERKDTVKEILDGLTERKERVKDFYGVAESVGVDVAINTIKEMLKQKGVDVALCSTKE